MQIARDVTSGALPNVWGPLEKTLIIWFTEPFILFVHIQWKTRIRCMCFSEESKLLAACHTENDQLSGLSSLLLGNRMERECICLRGILLELLEMYSLHADWFQHTFEPLLSSKSMTIENEGLMHTGCILICMQLLTCMQVTAINQCRLAAALCTQPEQE